MTDIARNLADQLIGRRQELAGYATNIAMYTAMVANDPGEWPSDLAPYRDWPPHEAAGKVPTSKVASLARLQQFERSRFLLNTETLEHAKMEALISGLQDAILVQHNDDQAAADAEIAAAEERRNNPPPQPPTP